MLPDEIEFESHPGSGLVSMCTDFVRPILEAVPTQHPMIARELGERFTWIAKCMPMTLPTPVELQHFNGMLITPSLMMRVRETLRQHQETLSAMCLPTTMQLFQHGLGIAKCPVPIDPDW